MLGESEKWEELREREEQKWARATLWAAVITEDLKGGLMLVAAVEAVVVVVSIAVEWGDC